MVLNNVINQFWFYYYKINLQVIGLKYIKIKVFSKHEEKACLNYKLKYIWNFRLKRYRILKKIIGQTKTFHQTNVLFPFLTFDCL